MWEASFQALLTLKGFSIDQTHILGPNGNFGYYNQQKHQIWFRLLSISINSSCVLVNEMVTYDQNN